MNDLFQCLLCFLQVSSLTIHEGITFGNLFVIINGIHIDISKAFNLLFHLSAVLLQIRKIVIFLISEWKRCIIGQFIF